MHVWHKILIATTVSLRLESFSAGLRGDQGPQLSASSLTRLILEGCVASARLGALMANLLFGIETEYAIAGLSRSRGIGQQLILNHLMDAARRGLVHLPDITSESSVYLENGSRIYLDAGGHPEMSSPECSNPWDVVRYTEAGHRIMAGLLSGVAEKTVPGADLLGFRCNVSYSGDRTTWGCHESYLHRRPPESLQSQLLPHLITRVIYTGAGGFNPLSRGVEFTLSPRVAHLEHVVSSSSTDERGIWHTKSEPLCSGGYRRLHLICGESLCSQKAAVLRTGATALIVGLADAGLTPGSSVQLAAPLDAMRIVASDMTCKKPLRMHDGREVTALEIQRHYLAQVESNAKKDFMPEWAPQVCRLWRSVLAQLEGAPESVSRSLDWGIKWALYARHARNAGLRWESLPFWNRITNHLAASLSLSDEDYELPPGPIFNPDSPISGELKRLSPIVEAEGSGWQGVRRFLECRQQLYELDWRFGQLGPKGLFESLDGAGVLDHHVPGVDNVDLAITEPPADGRARIRGAVIRRLAKTNGAHADWQHVVDVGKGRMLDLSDPFAREETWRRMHRSEKRSLEMVDFNTNLAHGASSRRAAALNHYLNGDFRAAETLLRGLLRERFETPSTHCHLSRVLIMMDREPEARTHTEQAWAARSSGPAYMVPRILFLKCLFAIFDGTPIVALLGELGAALNSSSPHETWTILPVLDKVRVRLGESNYEFLKALAEALSDASGMPRLEGFAQWRERARAA